MSALNTQIAGTHYREGGIQPVQYIEANNLPFLEGCVIKRLTRHARPTGKGREDIEKAIHELQLLLELRYPVAAAGEPTDPRMQTETDAEGWIEWEGGECPVIAMTLVDVRYRDGEEALGVPALMNHRIPNTRSAVDWGHKWSSPREIIAWRIHKPSQSAEPKKAAEPHEELRKTWKPGQRWELRWPLHGGAMSAWYPITAEQPMWDATCEYRRHPEDRDPEPQQWPYYSAGPYHTKAKELWGDGKGMEWALLKDDGEWSDYMRWPEPSFLSEAKYQIRPQGTQA